MAVDHTRLNYYDGWDIDQLVTSQSVAVASGVTAIATLPTELDDLPTVEVQFKPGAAAAYCQEGIYSLNPAGGIIDSFYSYILNGQLYIKTNTNGIARYFIWSDRIDYD